MVEEREEQEHEYENKESSSVVWHGVKSLWLAWGCGGAWQKEGEEGVARGPHTHQQQRRSLPVGGWGS